MAGKQAKQVGYSEDGVRLSELPFSVQSAPSAAVRSGVQRALFGFLGRAWTRIALFPPNYDKGLQKKKKNGSADCISFR